MSHIRSIVCTGIVWGLLLSHLAGQCSEAKIRLDELGKIRRGVTLIELRETVGTEPKHQFAATVDDKDYLCVSISFEKPEVSYYFLFKEKVLERIVESLPFEIELVSYKGTPREIQKPLDTEKRLRDVLRAPDLSGEAFVKSLKKRMPRQEEPLNILPAFVLSSRLWLAASDKIRQDYKKNEEMAKRFDPYKIQLKWSPEQVQTSLGKPLRKVKGPDGSVILVFGSEVPLRVNPMYRFSSVAVVFKDDKAVRIFSSDFFDKRLLTAPEAD